MTHLQKRGAQMGRFSELSDCELTTMKCIWDSAEPVTAHEIIRQLKKNYGLNYKESTVYTFLKKLKDKGFANSYRQGVTFYFPIREEEEYRSLHLNRARDFWFKGSTTEMVRELFRLKPPTPEERDILMEILEHSC
ncbi:MAG TPA: hypothetical protein DF613_13565 [Lachnospiraceae bacterium]|nr:hypothetical protein [Lachnospiraceae bacterium]